MGALAQAGAPPALNKIKIMKKLLLSCALASVIGAFSGCASDQPQSSTTSTTTEETTVQPVNPTTTTTEQTTVQPAN
jgi:Flp pilus assembly protein TadD